MTYIKLDRSMRAQISQDFVPRITHILIEMKSIILVCLMAFVALSMAGTSTYPRGCIYINGRCYEECPVGTHAYTTGCGYLTPQATCDKPNPVEQRDAILCDFSDCYCDAPTVRDTKTDKCVPLDQCS